jgi:hypothetical protein
MRYAAVGEVVMERTKFLVIMAAGAAILLVGCDEPGGGDADADLDADAEPDGDQDDEPVVVEPPSLSVSHEPYELTDTALEALDIVPGWLQDDLSINLGRVESIVQDELGALLLDLDDARLIDEVAFTIAHTSPEVLQFNMFFSELLVLDARLIYAYDDALDYVDIIDVGEPGVDPDFHTTLRYRMETDSGDVEEVTIEPELYYWYVVHPRLEDELPMYVNGWRSGRGTRPDEGWFWREFLWDAAADECPDDRECPLMVDFMADTEVLVRRAEDSAFAQDGIGQMFAFVGAVLHWGAGTERPVQPNRIYAVACGNCGEYADLHTAAARTALIPARNCGASSNDHTWVEWWYETVGWRGELDFYRGGVGRDRRDNDCDGQADDVLDDTDQDGDGFTVADGDCDDTDALVFPGATEVQNGHDDDCDGAADTGFADADLDGDGDGWLISEGDCRDANADVHPGAEEVVNGIDDDCDGIADDGTDTADADADGHSIEAGDCDDTSAAVFPDAEEVSNGIDDDCDGTADEGFESFDRDADGWTLASGDCDDLDAGTNPDAQDLRLGSNRLYAITTARGDSMVGIDRTEAYATLPSYLEFTVRDLEGEPVDGALITVFGTWEVYGEPDLWAPASEVITGLDGQASITVGETNPYGYAIVSAIGNTPDEGYLYEAVDRTEPYETYTVTRRVPGTMSVRPEVALVDLTGGEPAELTLSVALDVESHRIAGDGRLFGSFSWEQEGGSLDAYLMDEENYVRFQAGEAFEAQYAGQAAESVEESFDLPRTRAWVLVLSNAAFVASTMVGSLTMSATPPGDVEWTESPVALTTRFRIPPGTYAAFTVTP